MQTHHHSHHHPDSFQALLHDADSVDGEVHHHTTHPLHGGDDHPEDQDAVDRDLDMLIEQGDDSEMDIDAGIINDPGTRREGEIDPRDKSTTSAAGEECAIGDIGTSNTVKRSSIYNVVFNGPE
ncbi:hypothetical protein F4815DRAFT_487447 [Daldinia loculata]|nr:hypothetical protein F4815DRAFT_487447 [Daldinia loculata]